MSLRKFNKKGRLEKTLSTFPSPQTHCLRGRLCLLGFPLQWFEPTFPISALRKMGNSKKGTTVEEKLVFTGDQADFDAFRTAIHNDNEDKNRQRVTLAAQGICKVYHDIVAERTAKSATTPMQTDLEKFSSKKIASVELAIKQNLAPVTLDLALVKNKKDVIGSAWAEHDKMKITEKHLNTCHESIDQSYIVKCNRTVDFR